MSDDRRAQARAEAWRRYPEGWDPYNEEPVDDWGYSECQREAFVAGVEWADAREALLSDEAILRALNAEEPRVVTRNLADWSEQSVARMRRALTAAIGGDDE